MANKSIELLFFEKSSTHFLLPAVIYYRLQYSLFFTFLKCHRNRLFLYVEFSNNNLILTFLSIKSQP